ncbi:glycosyltransferase family 2 protein [Sanguibacter massiliensis]|uniref:glycosyltransferase family 2 protein n=1 Tax=Sanguibacter massiliensis TaxID=1973217 RepID=UPI001F5C7019|nr:glycosyltransferase family 2 protein [Sanguibacter massiliensis]
MNPDIDTTRPIRYSVIVPVYGNEGTLVDLVARLEEIARTLEAPMETVFVIDGSPDGSEALLRKILPAARIPSQIISHSRNFGSFAAIRTGLAAARGRYLGVMAADMQEPPELMATFFSTLEIGDVDVVVGRREARDDPAVSSLMSRTFWSLYRRTINKDLPPGGVDVFGCTREVAQELLSLREAHSSLVGLLYWVGYRRAEVGYARSRRTVGTSGWSFSKRRRYLLDSVFSFTDIPISALSWTGFIGIFATLAIAAVVFVSWATGGIAEIGYTPLMLVILFSTFVLLAGLGIVGSYVWRTYENSKARPGSITRRTEHFGAED